MFENINTKLDTLSSAVKNQLSFNKMIETQISQISSALSTNPGKDSGEPEPPFETVKMVTTRIGKPRRRSPTISAGSPAIIKKDDPGRPTITCSIGPHVFDNAYCDLGASVNIMSKKTNDTLFFAPLAPTKIRLQMADQTLISAEGIAEDICVKIHDSYIPTDFVVLDMGEDDDPPILLGRPFLNTANATIFVGTGRINFQIKEKTVRCHFNGYHVVNPVRERWPRSRPHHPKEDCSMIRLKYGPNKHGLREVVINPEHLGASSQGKNSKKKSEPKKKTALKKKNEKEINPKQKPEPKEKAAPKKDNTTPTPPEKVVKGKETLRPTSTLNVNIKRVWRKKETSTPTSSGKDAPSTSNK